VQVNGCLSWGDKIAHGFYNIMGIDPHMWAMCDADEDEGRRLPTLAALREVDASDQSSLEVLLVDKCGDSVLVDLERRALDLHRALGATLDFVRRLAVLVSNHMGYVRTSFLFDQAASFDRPRELAFGEKVKPGPRRCMPF
jgi:hypothetical protein